MEEKDTPIPFDRWENFKPTENGRWDSVNLTGMRFNRWTVLRLEGYRKGCGWYWYCRCDCGTEKVVLQRNLLEGRSKSCGCYRKDHMKTVRKRAVGKHKNIRTDLTGQRFGRWTVLGKAKHEVGKHPFWECRCDCGTVRAISHASLLNGHSQSCGCMRAEMQAHRYYFGSYYPDDAEEKWRKNHKEIEY